MNYKPFLKINKFFLINNKNHFLNKKNPIKLRIVILSILLKSVVTEMLELLFLLLYY